MMKKIQLVELYNFDLLNRNTSKVTKEIPAPSLCWACHFLPRGKKWQAQYSEGEGISFVTFDVLRFKRSKLVNWKALAMTHPLVLFSDPANQVAQSYK